MEIKSASTVELTNQEWADIIDTCGYGIAYWCNEAVVDEDACTYKIHDAEEDKTHFLIKSDIERAYALVLDGKVHVNETIRGYFLPDEDGDADIDAVAGDVLVQVACFGQIVYG